MFDFAEAYEVRMGRWSRQLAPLFVEFVGVPNGETVLDVGCGTGSLSATLARITGASEIVGIDLSDGLIEYARTTVTDRRVTFDVGDAQELPYSDASFDRCMALLAVDWIPDAWGHWFPLVVAITSMPLTFVLSNDAYYFGVVPILADAAAAYGIDPVEIARASVLGQPVHLMSPLVASTLLLVGMVDRDIGDFQKATVKWAVYTSLVITALAVLTGAISFFA